MPRRFEDFEKAVNWTRVARSFRLNTPISLWKKSGYRDKCSRAFSEIQYFTKEILSKNSELVGYFLVLT
jgi:hypothetical protein